MCAITIYHCGIDRETEEMNVRRYESNKVQIYVYLMYGCLTTHLLPPRDTPEFVESLTGATHQKVSSHNVCASLTITTSYYLPIKLQEPILLLLCATLRRLPLFILISVFNYGRKWELNLFNEHTK